jgi:hypothetical protein
MDVRKVLLKVLYWLAVLAVSIAILVGLITLLESRDKSSISGGVWISSAARS